MSASSLLDLDTPCLKLNILAFFYFFFFFSFKKISNRESKIQSACGHGNGERGNLTLSNSKAILME